jgi:hypothetical protein
VSARPLVGRLGREMDLLPSVGAPPRLRGPEDEFANRKLGERGGEPVVEDVEDDRDADLLGELEDPLERNPLVILQHEA